jgi:outer membrane protein TolC
MRNLVLVLLLSAGASAVASAAEQLPVDQQLEKISLKEAIRRALARNPNVEVQLAELRRAHAQLEEVRGASFPTLIGNGVYTRIDHDRILSSPQGNVLLQQADAVTLNVTATLPVLAPRAWTHWGEARENTRVAALSVADVRRQVAIAVAQSYLAIIERRREVELNVRARETAQAHFDYTHARLEGGRGSKLDDVRAEQELQNDASLVTAAELAVVRAQEALGVLVAGEVPVDTSEEPGLDEIDPERAQKDAPGRRADVLHLEGIRHYQHRTAKDDWSAYLPTLTASFAPIYTWPATVFTPKYSWLGQLVLTVPFYDGGVREGLLKEHRALEQEATANLKGLLRQARSDIRVGGEATTRTDQALQRARKAAELAHDAVKIATLAYEAGATTNIELIDAERNARDADTQAAVLEDQARQARIDLLFAAGLLP